MGPEEKSGQSPQELIHTFQILDNVAEILRIIQRGADASELTPVTNKLSQNFAKCESVLDRLAGGSMTRTEQLTEISRLKEGLQRKRELVERYGTHDLIARVVAQRAIPETEGGDDGVEGDDLDMEFPDVAGDDSLGVVGGEGDDVIMGLGI